MKATDTIVS